MTGFNLRLENFKTNILDATPENKILSVPSENNISGGGLMSMVMLGILEQYQFSPMLGIT